MAFVDSSCESFKVALLCNLGQRPSIPIVYGKISESHENVKKVLNLIKYEDYNFPIIGDFKIINFLMGMQCGNTKFPCYLCLFNSREKANHYLNSFWPLRAKFEIGEHNVIKTPLVCADKIIPPPLHIKLGIVKQFIKRLAFLKSEAITEVENLFPRLSSAKVSAGIMTGLITYKNECEWNVNQLSKWSICVN